MSDNTFGRILRLTTFGESHGPAVGGVVDGFPSNITLDTDFIQKQLDRRKPGQSAISTERKEADKVEFISGIFEGKSTGAPIAFLIHNKDMRSGDYDQLKEVYRPSHADYTYQQKFGIRDHRGGGRSSARTMAPWVAAGAMAAQIIPNIEVSAFVSSVGKISLNKTYQDLDLRQTDSNVVRCPDEAVANQMEQAILEAKESGDSLGGVVSCVIRNCPAGLGSPQFSKLNADLAHAMFCINAVKGVEFGGGFEMTAQRGSEVNDAFYVNENKVQTKSNNSGGIQGGISNGMDIFFRVAFKPVATISKSQDTINLKGEALKLEAAGRHDPCVVPRAAPIVEAMAKLVLADHFLLCGLYS